MGTGNCGCNDSHTASSKDLDTCLNVLASRPCRHIIRQLTEQPNDVAYYDELVDTYVSWVDEEVDRERVEIQCYHHHLPALQDAGLVEFDKKSGAVRYYPDEKVAALLDVVSQWEA